MDCPLLRLFGYARKDLTNGKKANYSRPEYEFCCLLGSEDGLVGLVMRFLLFAYWIAAGALIVLAIQREYGGDRGEAQAAASTVIVAAGDVSSCTSSNDTATANLVKSIAPYRVLGLGDLAYESGTLSEFNNCYGPTWGQFKSITRPAPGNHEYSSGGTGYFSYFGSLAGSCCKGYYVFNLGNWRIYSLNSERNVSTQVGWLKADMQTNRRTCTLAYWHKPYMSDGSYYPGVSAVKPLWDTFAANGGDLVLNGHDHNYQRFPITNGVQEMIVGTGGRSHYPVTKRRAVVVNSTTFGVLRLTLNDTSYSWKFMPAAGGSFTDSGSRTCR